MKLIGITGPSGSGKGLLSSEFRKIGIPVIDCDKVYHSLLVPPSPCLNAILNEMGGQYLAADGTLNRSALANDVFADHNKLEQLNKISHRYTTTRVMELVENYRLAGEEVVILDAPTLIEAGIDNFCDKVVAVLANPILRLERIMVRDSLSKEKALARIQAQPEDSFYRDHAHFVLYNNGDPKQLVESIHFILADTKNERG